MPSETTPGSIASPPTWRRQGLRRWFWLGLGVWVIVTLGFFGSSAWGGSFIAVMAVLVLAASAGEPLGQGFAIILGSCLVIAWLTVPVWSSILVVQRALAHAWRDVAI